MTSLESLKCSPEQNEDKFVKNTTSSSSFIPHSINPHMVKHQWI
jgi:hypothetical protein